MHFPTLDPNTQGCWIWISNWIFSKTN